MTTSSLATGDAAAASVPKTPNRVTLTVSTVDGPVVPTFGDIFIRTDSGISLRGNRAGLRAEG